MMIIDQPFGSLLTGVRGSRTTQWVKKVVLPLLDILGEHQLYQYRYSTFVIIALLETLIEYFTMLISLRMALINQTFQYALV